MRPEIFYFTYTGTSEEIALSLGKKLGSNPKKVVAPAYHYLIWLTLSFIPGIGVKISHVMPESRWGLFIFPKWTFNCPPATAFLRKVSFEKLLLIIVYGGWRERPYGEYYRKLAERRSREVDLHFVKRSSWKSNQKEELEKILEKVQNFFKERPS